MESELSFRIRWYTSSLHEQRKIIIKSMNCYIKELDEVMNKMLASHTPIPLSMQKELNLAKQFIESLPWKLENDSIISSGEIIARQMSGMVDEIKEILSKHIKN